MNARKKITSNIPDKQRNFSLSNIQKPKPSFSTNFSIDRALQLQRAIGNQAVRKLFESGVIQAKLTIGAPDDIYEQEADRMAEQVMRMPEPQLQKKRLEEKDETAHLKPLTITPLVQRQEDEEEEEKEEVIQLKKSSSSNGRIASGFESGINSLKGSGHPLPESTKKYFEPRFGVDFGDVRVHNDEGASQTAQAINAQAYTMGQDIVFRTGQYAPEASSGQRLLAHELTHVVQQIHNAQAPILQRAETDTKGQCEELKGKDKDSSKKLNEHINEILSSVRNKIEDPKKNRAEMVVKTFKEITEKSIVNILTPIEDWSNERLENRKAGRDKDWSKPEELTGGRPGTKYAYAPIASMYLAPAVNLNGICVGTDKIGHMFEQGFQYFLVSSNMSAYNELKGYGKGDVYAKAWGEWTEGVLSEKTKKNPELMKWLRETSKQRRKDPDIVGYVQGYFGLNITGVHSRADLYANEAGLQFYKDLYKNPLMTFDIRKYVSANWDEEKVGNIYSADIGAKVKRAERLTEKDVILPEETKEEKEESVQPKMNADHSPKAPSQFEKPLQAMRSNGQPLDTATRAYFEPRFEVDFGKVRVHTNIEASDTAQSINAQAYTTGHDIVFGAGHYVPESETGKRLLAHELTHVVQQSRAVTPPNSYILNSNVQRKDDEDTPYEECIPFSLTNTRFSPISRLRDIAACGKPLRGKDNGKPVKAIQQALLDIGYSLLRFHNDGLFGAETIEAITQFNADNKMAPGTDLDTAALFVLDTVAPPSGKTIEHFVDYERLLADNKLDFTLAIGYDEGKAHEGKTTIARTWLKDKGFILDTAVSTPVLEYYSIEKDITYPTSGGTKKTKKIKVNFQLIIPGTGAAAEFGKALNQSEISIYTGHARRGVGPDFDPKKSAAENFVIGVDSALHKARGSKLRLPTDPLYTEVVRDGINDIEQMTKSGVWDDKRYRVWFLNACTSLAYMDELRGGLLPGEMNRANLDIFGTSKTVPTPVGIHTSLTFIEGILEAKTMEQILVAMNKRSAEVQRGLGTPERTIRSYREAYFREGAGDNPVAP